METPHPEPPIDPITDAESMIRALAEQTYCDFANFGWPKWPDLPESLQLSWAATVYTTLAVVNGLAPLEDDGFRRPRSRREDGGEVDLQRAYYRRRPFAAKTCHRGHDLSIGSPDFQAIPTATGVNRRCRACTRERGRQS